MDGSTTVACHSDQSRHGKAGMLKAEDCYVVYGCALCHLYVGESYSATRAERFEAFDAGHVRQVALWRQWAEQGNKVAQAAIERLEFGR